MNSMSNKFFCPAPSSKYAFLQVWKRIKVITIDYTVIVTQMQAVTLLQIMVLQDLEVREHESSQTESFNH